MTCRNESSGAQFIDIIDIIHASPSKLFVYFVIFPAFDEESKQIRRNIVLSNLIGRDEAVCTIS